MTVKNCNLCNGAMDADDDHPVFRVPINGQQGNIIIVQVVPQPTHDFCRQCVLKELAKGIDE
jgi:hypothetical protein